MASALSTFPFRPSRAFVGESSCSTLVGAGTISFAFFSFFSFSGFDLEESAFVLMSFLFDFATESFDLELATSTAFAMTLASVFADFGTEMSGLDFGFVETSILGLTDASSLDLITDVATDFAFGVKVASILDLWDDSDDFDLTNVSVIDGVGVNVDVNVMSGLG